MEEKKAAVADDGEEWDQEAADADFAAMIEEEEAAAAEAAEGGDEEPAEEEGEEGEAAAKEEEPDLAALEALLARLVVREEDTPAGIEACISAYNDALSAAADSLGTARAASVNGLADSETILAHALYNLDAALALAVPVPEAVALPEEFAAEEADETQGKEWLLGNCGGATFSPYGGENGGSCYCPVALHHEGALTLGLSQHAAKYQQQIYLFASDAARDMFIANPRIYLSPKPTPPKGSQRIALVGGPASGNHRN